MPGWQMGVTVKIYQHSDEPDKLISQGCPQHERLELKRQYTHNIFLHNNHSVEINLINLTLYFSSDC